MTIFDAYEEFMNIKLSHCVDKTLIVYRDHLQIFLDYVSSVCQTSPEDTDLSVIDSAFIRNYILSLRNRKCFENHPYIPDSQKTIANTTIRSYCRPLKAFLRYCIREDYLPDVLKNVRFPSSDPALKHPLYQEEVRRIDGCFDLDDLLGLRNYCIFHLMLDCGLRSGEVIRLKNSQIFYRKQLLYIHKSKYNKSRHVPLPDPLAGMLQSYFQKAGSDFFRNRNGNPVTPNTVKMFFQGLKENSGVIRVYPHLLRHTFGTSFIVGGGDIEVLRILMGHSDYVTTKMYITMAAEMKVLHADIYRLDPLFFQRGY